MASQWDEVVRYMNHVPPNTTTVISWENCDTCGIVAYATRLKTTYPHTTVEVDIRRRTTTVHVPAVSTP